MPLHANIADTGEICTKYAALQQQCALLCSTKYARNMQKKNENKKYAIYVHNEPKSAEIIVKYAKTKYAQKVPCALCNVHKSQVIHK